MHRTTIPRAEWARYAALFSRAHQGWLVRIPGGSSAGRFRRLWIRTKGRGEATGGADIGGGTLILLEGLTGLIVESDERDLDCRLSMVGKQGSELTLRFLNPARPETVDGSAKEAEE